MTDYAFFICRQNGYLKFSYTISPNFSYIALKNFTKKLGEIDLPKKKLGQFMKKLGVLNCPKIKLGEIDLPKKKVRAIHEKS